ncbi:hypothetical protein [Embleya sp. NPDC001921]
MSAEALAAETGPGPGQIDLAVLWNNLLPRGHHLLAQPDIIGSNGQFRDEKSGENDISLPSPQARPPG